MRDIVEIRWHGRGGQGAKTAAVLLAEVVAAAGKYVQGFPEYGPERMGAPVLAFNRISEKPITIHCNVTEPNLVLVLDDTLIGSVDVTDGLAMDGSILVNTSRSPSEVKGKLKLKDGRVYTVNASQIALDILGKNIPNTPMIGALIKVADLMDYETFKSLMRTQLDHKFKHKTDLVDKNIRCIERAYEEVQGSV